MVIVSAIVAAEVAFWVFLAGGLAARYLLRRPRLGLALLLGSPAADLALLLLSATDLHRGALPTQAHALAAAYLGFSVAFGHSVVRWADRWFDHRFAGGPALTKPRRTRGERAAHEGREFRKAALAWAVSVALLLGMTVLVGDVGQAQPLLAFAGTLTLVLVIWFVTGPLPAGIAARSGREELPPGGADVSGDDHVAHDARRRGEGGDGPDEQEVQLAHQQLDECGAKQ